MSDIKNRINRFFVDCFNSILRQEEKSLEKISNGKLSLKEIHVIEAVKVTTDKSENTMGGVSKYLNVTLGTLTVAVNVLERKGYILKTRDENDKRIIYLSLTDLGMYVNDCHTHFHEQMVNDIVTLLDENEQEILINSLIKLQQYFKKG